MTSWAVLAGAAGAAALAWVVLAGAAYLGDRHVRTGPIRAWGAAALAALALAVAGLPVPWLVPPALLALGLIHGVAPAAAS